MKSDELRERQLEYIQRKLKVSREHILETCRITKVSLEKIVHCLDNSKKEFNRLSLRV